MKPRTGFTLIELLVVISIISLLMAILIPTLSRVRKQALAVTCTANLSQWGLMLTMYAQDNNGSLPTGWNGGTMWMVDLLRFYNGERDVCLCPAARKFLHLIPGNVASTFTAWGKYGEPGYFNGWTPSWGLKGLYGSYGISDWVHNPLDKGVPGTYDIAPGDRPLYWRKITVRHAAEIPAFGDCMWDGATPRVTDAPPPVEGQQVQGSGMSDFCIDRHLGHTNMAFLDGSVRKVGLKQLWRLRWSVGYDLKAKLPNWPDWMKGLKDYN
jgi:prepilin-type N-terminal cleavage/methylation domain-containing protein/prepilin-type processing-associated H-X9-DG protein